MPAFKNCSAMTQQLGSLPGEPDGVAGLQSATQILHDIGMSMQTRRLIIDLSSILTACHRVGIDGEFGRKVTFEGKQHQVNSADWAFENFMVSYRSVLDRFGLKPYQTIVVLDGRDSRHLRRNIWSAYKAHRPKSPPELNQEYAWAIEGVVDEITAHGGLAVKQDMMEADDVVAYLSKTLLGYKLLWSRDADFLAIRSETTDILLKDELNPTFYESCPDTKWVLLYKALCGDSSDGFPGAKGFGPKAFQKLAMQFGAEGLEELEEMIQKRQLDQLDTEQLKELGKVVEHAKDVYTSYALAKFYPDAVNTSASPLEIQAQVIRQAGADTHELMRQWAGTKTLLAPDDTASIAWVAEQLRKSPAVALDIETDTPPESKEWVKRLLENSSKKSMIDIIGSYLVGMSLTFGDNMQHTVYIPVRHAGEGNWNTGDVADLVGAIPEGADVFIHNVAFELPVLFNEWGGWVEGAVDTALMCSYVDENESMGLKQNSKRYFGYEQTTYEQMTTKEGPVGSLQGGEVIKTFMKEISPAVTHGESKFDELGDEVVVEVIDSPAVFEEWETRQYGMSELTAAEVFDYGCDDTICTAALANRLRFTMELESVWETFLKVEQPVSYVVAEAYVRGLELDWDKLARLREEDQKTFERHWQDVVRPYLLEKGWPGGQYMPFERTPAGIKVAFETLTGKALDCKARMEHKIIAAVREQGCPELAEALESTDETAVDELLRNSFVPEPIFSVSKSADLRKLLFEAMGLPVRFRTVPTENMRAKGIREGSPQADASAISHALALDLEEGSPEYAVLLAIRAMKACETREGLYYAPYPYLRHWKTGRLHSNPGQSRTSTRRFASNNPNLTQISKYKDEGKVRSTIIAPPGYVLVTADFTGQELRGMGEASQDPALLSCYLGDDLKDPHTLTAVGIAKRRGYAELSEYEAFVAALQDGNKLAKATRNLGKSTNFATAYGCLAPKLAKMLVCSVDDAGIYLAAKNEVYAGLAAWQQATIKLARQQGYVTTPLGARRHLYAQLNHHDKWTQLSAERQAVNFCIQGAAGEQTKLAMGSMHLDGVLERHGIQLLASIHDEIVVLIPVESLVDGIIEFHACMIQNYADSSIPAVSDVSMGWNFGELESVGTEPTREKILAAYEALLTVKREEVKC